MLGAFFGFSRFLVPYWTLAGKLEVFAERSEIWPVHVQWPSKLKLRWTRCPPVLV